jgi:hypothetical protein
MILKIQSRSQSRSRSRSQNRGQNRGWNQMLVVSECGRWGGAGCVLVAVIAGEVLCYKHIR